MVKLAAVISLIFMFLGPLAAQDTLPRFTATTRGNNRVLISWTNPYQKVTQINIQRSPDSTRNFKTILSVPGPENITNGFVDTKPTTPFMFYRLFIVLDSGKYLFSVTKRAVLDTSKIEPPTSVKNPATNNRRVITDSLSAREADRLRDKLNNRPTDSVIAKPEPERFFVIKRRDSVLGQISEKLFQRFRDSVVFKTKDTMVFRSIDTIVIKPFVPKEVYKPSVYVFTEKDGNVSIQLPDASHKHYMVKFYDDKSNPIFEIPRIKESPLILDKANFLKAGWYRFELFEEGKLKEKNKFFIPKDF